MKTLWLKETGEPKSFEAVDAREILAKSDLYTDVDPAPVESPPLAPPPGPPLAPPPAV